MQCKQHPFAGCTIAFLGFTEEEEDHMKEVAQSNGEHPHEPYQSVCPYKSAIIE